MAACRLSRRASAKALLGRLAPAAHLDDADRRGGAERAKRPNDPLAPSCRLEQRQTLDAAPFDLQAGDLRG